MNETLKVVIRRDAGALEITPSLIEDALNYYFGSDASVTVFNAVEYGKTSNCVVCEKRIVFCDEDVWLHCEPQDHGFAKPPSQGRDVLTAEDDRKERSDGQSTKK